MHILVRKAGHSTKWLGILHVSAVTCCTSLTDLCCLRCLAEIDGCWRAVMEDSSSVP